MGLRILSDGQRSRFIDLATGAKMLDSSELWAALEAERQQRLVEHAARLEAEAELRQLHGEEEGN
jgi:hypothetical protein